MPNSGRTTCARSFTLILLLSGAFSFDLACATDKVDERESSEHAPPASGGANRLQHETSPYLLLHAHNPVDWYPWGPEAIARARDEDKPIFLSVGYSTCYWCHVMERKVFANDEIAAMMNEWFVNIKVDREERPDLDQIYMTATQLMSGSGGWPNSVFLTTDLKPFYAGTYFPPADSHGRPGFPRILQALHDAWLNERQKVEEVGAQLAEAIRQAQDPGQGEGDAARALPDSSLISRAVDAITMRYDGTHGGFGGAPKFPPAMRLDLLLDAPVDTVEEENKLEAIVTHTLSAMARGGMYDQIGGGFHRYSTDARWLVPHFRKNALQPGATHPHLRPRLCADGAGAMAAGGRRHPALRRARDDLRRRWVLFRPRRGDGRRRGEILRLDRRRNRRDPRVEELSYFWKSSACNPFPEVESISPLSQS